MSATPMRWLAPTIALAIAIAAGCGDEPAPTGPFAIDIGTGDTSFVPLMDGETVPLATAGQGGFHIWLSFKAEGLAPERSLLDLTLSTDDPELGAHTALHISLVPDPEADSPGALFVGWPALLPTPACFVGETLNIEATITNPSGRSAHGVRTIVVGPPVGFDVGTCQRD